LPIDRAEELLLKADLGETPEKKKLQGSGGQIDEIQDFDEGELMAQQEKTDEEVEAEFIDGVINIQKVIEPEEEDCSVPPEVQPPPRSETPIETAPVSEPEKEGASEEKGKKQGEWTI